ncbi:MFS transporter [Streptosporangium sp. NPDC004379]|uniref:MFS transporter n=1 Tax=Streptosporangium sp. NPDC004379 TaxID=3366189 RepID=UPI0036AC47F9
MTRRRWMLASFTLAVLLFATNVTVLNALGPALADGLAVPPTSEFGITYSYLLAFVAVVLPLKARKSLLISGLAAFFLASLVCAFATDVGVLIGGRVLQGLAAAVVIRAGIMFMTGAFPGTRVWTAAVAPLVAAMVGLMTGSVLGLVIADHFRFDFVFLLDALLAVVVAVAVAVTFPGTKTSAGARQPDPHPLDSV